MAKTRLSSKLDIDCPTPPCSYDGGYINASAEGVSIRTALQLSRDATGRIKVSNVSCQASVSRMHAAFGGTFK